MYCTCVGPPSPYGNVTVTDTSCLTTYNTIISWNPFNGDPVCGPVLYNVTILPSNGVIIKRISDTFYNLTGLTPDTNYTVIVTGTNMAGVGESLVTFYIPNLIKVMPSGELNYMLISYMYSHLF